jgi:IS1 family transposase
MRIDVDKAAFALRLLLEGMSIRATERMTGLHRDTLCDLVATAGENCAAFLTKTIHNVESAEVEVDELWGFVGCKQRTCERNGYGPEFGDAYCFVGIDRNTKLILTYHVAKRDNEGTATFIRKLRKAVAGRPQLSSDGWAAYKPTISFTFWQGVDYAQIIKTYGPSPESVGPQRRYSPAQIIKIARKEVFGEPDMDRLCTSHVERMNLSIRMGLRRMTRLTNGHSKKWENHEAMLSLYFAWFNFVRKHQTLKTTPAVAAGLASEPWSIERLLTEAASPTHC